MPTCKKCSGSYVHGQIICPNCAEDLDEPLALESPPAQLLPVAGVYEGVVHIGRTITLNVIEIDDRTFPEGRYFAIIPVQRLQVPVRIGRMDLSQFPHILPEFNLGGLLANLQPGLRPVVSRLHATLQLEREAPVVKPLVDHSAATWVRHTGSDRFSPIPPNTLRRLEDRDCIVLGHPKGRHVTLRVVFSHP
ncbi:hypothetical protein EPN81_00355 [Patescibacteria group bacterium]|nr:MAG: hypothetical protein EPN81_00355 [Patescibacteria group bacterium]